MRQRCFPIPIRARDGGRPETPESRNWHRIRDRIPWAAMSPPPARDLEGLQAGTVVGIVVPSNGRRWRMPFQPHHVRNVFEGCGADVHAVFGVQRINCSSKKLEGFHKHLGVRAAHVVRFQLIGGNGFAGLQLSQAQVARSSQRWEARPECGKTRFPRYTAQSGSGVMTVDPGAADKNSAFDSSRSCRTCAHSPAIS